MVTKQGVCPTRSVRFGVGKEIGGAVYVHCKYEDRLGDAVPTAKKHLPEDFEYDVVKYNYRTGAVSFVQCPEFNISTEPTVGDMLTVDAEGGVRRRRQPRDPEIYHHKWLFVADDYAGFDIEASRRRSLAWMRLEGIDRKRIGRKSYWDNFVIPRLNDAEELNSRVG